MTYLSTYSCRNVVISYAGLNLESGKGDDTFLTIEYEADRFSYTTGCSGDTAVSLSPNHGAKITLTYQATSDSARLLAFLHGGMRAAELKGVPTLGAVPILVADPSGSTFALAKEAALVSVGTNTLGLGENTRDFVFHTPMLAETALPSALSGSIGSLGLSLLPSI